MIVHRWTPSAIECYRRGCRCQGCTINLILGKRCRMKNSVIELVRQLGTPPKNNICILKGVTPIQNKIIDAIIAGAKTKPEIAKVVEVSSPAVQKELPILYGMVETLGYKFKRVTNRLPELVEILIDLNDKLSKGETI